MKKFINNLKSNKKNMVMVIFLIVFLIVTFCFVIFGNSSDTDETDDTTDETSSSSSVSYDVSAYASDELIDCGIDTPSFQVGDTVIYLGTSTVSDLTAAGAEYQTDGEAQVLDFSEDAYATRTVTFLYGDTTFYVVAQNASSSVAPLSNSIIIRAAWLGSDVYASGGITVGSSLASLIGGLGASSYFINSESYENSLIETPELSRIYLYLDESDHATIKVGIDRNTYEVSYLELQSPSVCVTDASEVTSEQLELLAEEYLLYNSISNVSYKEDMESSSVSLDVLDCSFVSVAVAQLTSFGSSFSAYYLEKLDEDATSGILLAIYEVTGENKDTTYTGYGALIVYDPETDASGSIVSASDRDIVDWKTVYPSKEALMEAILSDIEKDSYIITADDFLVSYQ